MANKMKYIYTVFAIASLITGISNHSQAQGIKDVDVTVKTAIKPKLADAVKIDVIPVQDENIKVNKPDMTYTTEPFVISTAPYKTRLQTMSIKNVPLPELQHSFVKGAFGNYSDLYGEIFYNTLRNRTSLLSVDLKHQSGNGPVKNSGFSTNLIDLFGSQIIRAKYELTGSLGYQRDANHFYATIPDNLKPIGLKDYQAFNDFHAKAGFANTGADTGKLRYNLGLGYYSFTDYYKTAESDVTVLVKADEPLGSNHIILNGSYDYMNYKTESALTRTLLKINLGYSLKTGILRAYLGFKTADEKDSNNNVFHFYPDVNVEADLVEKYLTVFGGITGNLEKNTYKSLAYENPFMISNPALRNVNDKFELFGGLKGSFSSNSSFLLSVALKNYHNFFFYLQDTIDRRKFVPVYDTGTTTNINLHGELAWSFTQDLDLSTKFDYNTYSVSTLKIQKPFERPAFQWMLTGNYNLDNKIVFGTDVFFVSSRYSTDLKEKEVTTLKPFIDMNAHVSYAFANVKGLKAFIELNNLFGNKYQIWNNYPVRGFQILGGVMYSFL
jgi:hypothetical protein